MANIKIIKEEVSKKRFKVDYEVGVLDTLTNEIVTDCQNAEEVVALLNQLWDENEQLRQDHKRQENEIKMLRAVYSKIPPKIREVWKE